MWLIIYVACPGLQGFTPRASTLIGVFALRPGESEEGPEAAEEKVRLLDTSSSHSEAVNDEPMCLTLWLLCLLCQLDGICRWALPVLRLCPLTPCQGYVYCMHRGIDGGMNGQTMLTPVHLTCHVCGGG